MAAVVLALLALAVLGCGSGSDAPAGGQQLRDGGQEAFDRELRQRRGKPVVINQWASWCPPCRDELPYFSQLAKRYQGKVAFLGINATDNEGDARRFLAEYPTPFPHFADPNADIARSVGAGQSWPTTVFYDANGERSYIRQGAYKSIGDLRADIQAHALAP